MPANGEPLVKLRTIIVEATTMKGVLPAKLPNLEELVINAQRGLELSFEDSLAIFSAVKTFYAFGKPATTEGLNIIKVLSSGILARRGLTLGAAFAKETKDLRPVWRGSSCIYLKPCNTQDKSISLKVEA